MVSVIIPAYNRAGALFDAAQSVLKQTWRDLELIIVDDGSTDNTEEVVAKINDDRVRYIKMEKNCGACAARNQGIDLSKGEFIAFHDSDDVWRPQKLEKEMHAIQKSGADIVFCKLVKHDQDGSQTYMPIGCSEGFLKPVVSLFGIGTQTLLGKSEVFKNTRFDPEMPRFQEFELLYRASKKYSIYCVDEGLVDYYVGDDSISSNPKKLYRACELLCDKHPEIIRDFPVMAEEMANCLLQAAKQIKHHNKKETRKYIVLAFKCHMNLKLIIKAILILIGILR